MQCAAAADGDGASAAVATRQNQLACADAGGPGVSVVGRQCSDASPTLRQSASAADDACIVVGARQVDGKRRIVGDVASD